LAIGLRVLAPVYFNGKAFFMAVEIKDIAAAGMLASELETCQLAVT